jgi:type IV pilus assembly protein PilE
VTIAYPSYQEQVRKSRRGDAKQALMDAASRQEQYILDHSTYTADMEELGYGEDPAVSEEDYYTEKCTEFSVTSTGVRTAEGSLGNECW